MINSYRNPILASIRIDVRQRTRLRYLLRWWADAIEQYRLGVPFVTTTDDLLDSCTEKEISDAVIWIYRWLYK